MLTWTPDELKEQLDRGERIFLKLWKPGCGACKLSVPAMERVEKANVKNLNFGQIDVEEFPQMLDIAETEVLPCFFIFTDKKLKGKLIGFKGLKKVESFIEESA